MTHIIGRSYLVKEKLLKKPIRQTRAKEAPYAKI